MEKKRKGMVHSFVSIINEEDGRNGGEGLGGMYGQSFFNKPSYPDIGKNWKESRIVILNSK